MKTTLSIAVSSALIGGLLPMAASAHHSFAMFDTSKSMLVEGTVTNWAYNNPHSWLYIEAPNAEGEMVTWGFEGGAPVHVTRQGVTGSTFQKGDKVQVVMCPLRDGRPAGSVSFVVKEDGSVAYPHDAHCQGSDLYPIWQENGLLDEPEHLHVMENPGRG